MTNKEQTELAFSAVLHSPSQLDQPTLNIGLVSLDQLTSSVIGIHPYAITSYEQLDDKLQQSVLEQAEAYGSPAEFFVSELSKVLVEAAQKAYDKPLKVKLSGEDSYFRRSLKGNELEEQEVNPAIGLRGVSRFANKASRASFELECEAIKRARNDAGMKNIELVIPFIRTMSESATVIDLLAEQGLCRGADGLKVHFMCELPANAVLADKFLCYFDGMVVDIDQLGQFAMALDQEHPALTYLHDDQNEAVHMLVEQAIKAAREVNKPCDVISQFLPKAPKLQRWLLEQGVKTAIRGDLI